jgi:hypothetical protein
MIPPHASLDYFREFNAGGKRNIEKWETDPNINCNYLFAGIWGELIVTDGREVEEITCRDLGPAERDVVMRAPVEWRTIPENATVVREK